MTSYEPYEPAEGDKTTETAGHAGFLAWLAARIDKTIRDRERGYISPGELKPYPYELQSCAEHIVAMESTIREFLDLLDKGKLASMNLEEKARRLVRTPEEWREWEKKEDAEFAKKERASERALLKTMTPEERKLHKARREMMNRLFNGKD